MDFTKLNNDLNLILDDMIEMGHLEENDIFVLGCSTSEVHGKRIGKDSSQEIGKMIIETIIKRLKPYNIRLAVQGCEHINRALVVERETMKLYNLPEVTVVPSLHAGGAAALEAYKQFHSPVVVEHIQAKAGLDIGDTLIGMHIKHVQIPVRPRLNQLGDAHVTAATSRPKLIGGPRAKYSL